MICCLPPRPAPRPALSICIPTWNRSAKLQAQLRGLIPHLSDTMEIVVVDNGSDDDTLDGVRAIAAEHPGARLSLWANETNLGADVNYLRALELGTGEWLWLLGDDEDINPSKVQDFLASLGMCNADLAMLFLEDWGGLQIPLPSYLSLSEFLTPAFDKVGYAIHKIGLFALRRDKAYRHLRTGYSNGIGTLHSYSFLTLALLEEGQSIYLLPNPDLFLHGEKAVRVGHAPEPIRWNGFAGELGAWMASERALPGHRNAVRQRETRLRFRNLAYLALREMTGPHGISNGRAGWVLRLSPVRHKPLALAIVVLSQLPRRWSRWIASGVLRVGENDDGAESLSRY